MVVDLIVNGEARAFENVRTLGDLLAEIDASREGSGIAVAVNGTVVPRTAWIECALRPGDRVEVIHAVQGG
ncbi:MAG: sulfur carrier protein ThiS [bacterium]|nr:sulfur carrier protein ThiS [bacterium]